MAKRHLCWGERWPNIPDTTCLTAKACKKQCLVQVKLTRPAHRTPSGGADGKLAQSERLLSQIEAPVPPPYRLRLGRALAALEQVDSPQTRDILQRLAGGAEGAWLTQEAHGSLKRLGRKRAEPR
jgi:hypothetical protein